MCHHWENSVVENSLSWRDRTDLLSDLLMVCNQWKCLLSHLQSKYDDQKEPVGRQHESALLQRPAVPEERDDEDEAADGDEDVGGVVQHWGVGELLQDVLCLRIALKIILNHQNSENTSWAHLDNWVKLCNSQKMIFVSYNPQSNSENYTADDL